MSRENIDGFSVDSELSSVKIVAWKQRNAMVSVEYFVQWFYRGHCLKRFWQSLQENNTSLYTPSYKHAYVYCTV